MAKECLSKGFEGENGNQGVVFFKRTDLRVRPGTGIRVTGGRDAWCVVSVVVMQGRRARRQDKESRRNDCYLTHRRAIYDRESVVLLFQEKMR